MGNLSNIEYEMRKHNVLTESWKSHATEISLKKCWSVLKLSQHKAIQMNADRVSLKLEFSFTLDKVRMILYRRYTRPWWYAVSLGT